MNFATAVLLAEADENLDKDPTLWDRVKQLPSEAQKRFEDIRKRYGTTRAALALGLAVAVPGGVVLAPAYLKSVDWWRGQ